MVDRYDFVEYYKDEDDARRAMAAVLTGPTPKVGYRDPGRTPPGKGANFGPAGEYLKKYFDEQRRNKPEGSSDWTSYTDFQDYKPRPAPPTNYSYLSNGYGG